MRKKNYFLIIFIVFFIFRESGELPIGSRVKMTGTQMNQYMNKFLQSSRTGQTNPISDIKKVKR